MKHIVLAALISFSGIAMALPVIVGSDTTIEMGFTKTSKPAKDLVVKAIDESVNTLDIAVYYLTERDILLAMYKAVDRGVDVRVVLDRSQKDSDSVLGLITKGIKCRIDNKHTIMHHKFLIVDGVHTLTGSLNFTTNGSKRNAENVIYIRNYTQIADTYTEEFNRVYIPAPLCETAQNEQK